MEIKLYYKPQNQQVQKVMSQRSAGSWTRCTRSNAFPDHVRKDIGVVGPITISP